MSRISYYNHEGYRDPTAYAALNSAEKAFQQKQHTKALKSEAAELHGEMEVVTELMKQAIAQNASMAMDQEEYAARYNALAERFQTAADRYKAIEAECASRTSQRKMLTSFAKQLMGSDEKVSEFTPTLWNTMVEKVTVDTDGILHFTFKNGTVLCA